MEELEAKKLLEKHHFQVSDIKRIPEGFNNYVFDVVLLDGFQVIAKIKKRRVGKEQRESLFNGLVSSGREGAICGLVRKKAVLPAPKVYLKHDSEEVSLLVTEKLKGVTWCQYLRHCNFSREKSLLSLEELGKDIAKLHQVTFQSFGDIMDEETVGPEIYHTFTDRFLYVMNIRMDRALKRGVFTKNEMQIIRNFFVSECYDVATSFHVKVSKPVMVFTDMHPDNFLVDETGRPSGYFDLEACQAAPPVLEFCGLKLFLFNYFDEAYFRAAEEAFFCGYKKQGGTYDRLDSANIKLENVLATGRILELTESYFQVKDGLRNTWSDRFKILLWQTIEEKQPNYQTIGEIYREKTKQPKKTNH